MSKCDLSVLSTVGDTEKGKVGGDDIHVGFGKKKISF
jgi:hypothetical protein